ncbi:OLC1v1023171C1 [Oldenlandia corymbosa var. corymbosa]|uniref:OLC1v1023171C1 n=1 Tax=Oldenlandia corymbosa var. corymbosa TaxID=529605 RepID=A0AAV1C250_OLDCO|nr:OLC1v1023171C1 [Oldenlandia corymbosa var. corymbosa]
MVDDDNFVWIIAWYLVTLVVCLCLLHAEINTLTVDAHRCKEFKKLLFHASTASSSWILPTAMKMFKLAANIQGVLLQFHCGCYGFLSPYITSCYKCVNARGTLRRGYDVCVMSY